MIKKCDCKHEFQDKEYGKGNRMHNPIIKKQGVPQQYRCTVCEKVK